MLDTVEVGMPMTGQNNLAENPLLKDLGHLRWTHISSVCGVRSRDITTQRVIASIQLSSTWIWRSRKNGIWGRSPRTSRFA